MYEFGEFYGLIIILIVIAVIIFIYRSFRDKKNTISNTEGKFTYHYPRPAVTVDILVFSGNQILLIKRKANPFRDRWALPGGFIEMSERLEEAAIRELREETNIDVDHLIQFRTYDTPDRDPRGRTISIAFYTFLTNIPLGHKAGDDAKELQWFPITDLPPLAFDHDKILSEAKQFIFDNPTIKR